jgi:hypothetical protein
MSEDDKPTGKAKGGHARAEKLPPERRSEIAKLAADARWADEPLTITEDAETGDRFVLYTKPDGLVFDLRFDGDEPWATQKQIADLFGRDITVVRRHLKSIFNGGELDEDAVSAKTALTAADGKTYNTRIYNLDAILAVGYRAGSKEAMLFRRWASQILRQYLLHGFVIDTARLENPDGRPDHFADLLAKVRHIRSSEKRMWTRVLELASFCDDYGTMTDDDKQDFFATIQNAMHWATTQQTAAEVIWHRVDASKDNAGVVTFSGELPTVKEAQTAKNFYGPGEIEALNLVTSLTLEFFESQAEQRKPTTIAQFLDKMRDLLKLDGRPLIGKDNRGRISMPTAKAKASTELKAFKDRIRIERENTGERALQQIGDAIKKRPKAASSGRPKRGRT